MSLINTAEQAAKELIENKFPIEDYMVVQNRRLERLAFWKERGVPALIEKETELVEFGEKVLQLMREAYGVSE